MQLGEAERGPLRSDPGEQSEIEGLILSERDDFPLEQSQEESLKHAFEQVRYIDGQPLQLARTLSYPYFAIIKKRLYRVTQDKGRYNTVVSSKKPSGNAFPGSSF